MKIKLFTGILLGLLAMVQLTPVLGHEGHDHTEKKDEGLVVWERPEKSVEILKKLNGKEWRISLGVYPGTPLPGENLDLHLILAEKLTENDPLLGDSLPFSKNKLVAKVNGQQREFKNPLGAGEFEIHTQAPKAGPIQLDLELEPGKWVNLTYPVLNPPEDRRLIGLRKLFLGGLAFLFFAALGIGLRQGKWAKALVETTVLTAFFSVTLFGAYVVAKTYFLPEIDEVWMKHQIASTTVEEKEDDHDHEEGDDHQEEEGPDNEGEPGPPQMAPTAPTKFLEFQGDFSVPPGKEHEVNTPAQGVLHPTKKWKVGDRVQKGQLLATVRQFLDTTAKLEVEQAQMDLEKTKQEIKLSALELQNRRLEKQTQLQTIVQEISFATTDLSRAKSLYELEAISLRDLQEKEFKLESLKTTQKGIQAELKNLTIPPLKVPKFQNKPQALQFSIKAPISGVITELHIAHGEGSEEGKEVFVIRDDSQLWVGALFQESQLPLLNKNSIATIWPASLPGKSLPGRFAMTDTHTDPATRTTKVFFSVPSAGGKLRPGGTAKIVLKANP